MKSKRLGSLGFHPSGGAPHPLPALAYEPPPGALGIIPFQSVGLAFPVSLVSAVTIPSCSRCVSEPRALLRLMVVRLSLVTRWFQVARRVKPPAFEET
jgi:hypothetical protein